MSRCDCVGNDLESCDASCCGITLIQPEFLKFSFFVLQTVQRTVLCMGRKQEAVENVPCGNTVGPTIDKEILLRS
jgi:hypothetical protein